MNFLLVIIIISGIGGGYNLFKIGKTFQLENKKKPKDLQKIRKLYFRLILNSLVFGVPLGALFVNSWSQINGSWIALPCFSTVFMLGSIRYLKAL